MFRFGGILASLLTMTQENQHSHLKYLRPITLISTIIGVMMIIVSISMYYEKSRGLSFVEDYRKRMNFIENIPDEKTNNV